MYCSKAAQVFFSKNELRKDISSSSEAAKMGTKQIKNSII